MDDTNCMVFHATDGKVANMKRAIIYQVVTLLEKKCISKL
jgi:hypothetical protein